MRGARWILRTGWLAAGLIGFALSGCASYVNYPPIDTAKDDAAVNDPNVSPVPSVIRAALRRVLESYPVEGDYFVNLPEGMTRRRAEEVIARLRDARARLPSSEAGLLPAYHVTRVWLRPGDKAEVEILRPVFGVGTPGDLAQYQPVTVRLRRGPLEDWKVANVRVWPIGMIAPPPLYGWQAETR